jgi:hypothetical protein
MIIKAFYMLDGEIIKSVRFEADSDFQPEDKQVIYANAPERWDSCVWDNGKVMPQRKKRKLKPLEEAMENTVSDEE